MTRQDKFFSVTVKLTDFLPLRCQNEPQKMTETTREVQQFCPKKLMKTIS